MKRISQKQKIFALILSALSLPLGVPAAAQTFATTTVQGTVYLANGKPGSGTLQLSWPAFTTAQNQAVAAGRTTVTIGADGFLSVNLAPNQSATPAGLYYTAVYHLSDGTTSTEYWTVPAIAQASIAQVRATVMPAAQAVQAVSKGYVDQAVQQLVQSQLTSGGGNLTGPLFLNGDPLTSTQAATKHYVDGQFAQTLPRLGGAATGPLTATQLGAAFQADQFQAADFGAQLQACVNALNASYGGTCDARNFSGSLSMSSNVTVGVGNATIQLPCATITTASQIVIPAGTRNVTLHGCASRGTSAASGSQGGTVILYSGPAAVIQVGDSTYGADTQGFHLDNVAINTTPAPAATAQAIVAWRTQELRLESLYLLGNSNQIGITLDGTGNYAGGTFEDDEISGFGTAINAIGHQKSNPAPTDWLNASTFLRLHIVCPTANGNPIAGTTGINLVAGDGNTFTGGDVEGCATALHLGPNAQNNTIVGLRNENSTSQVVADAGSAYNNWMTGGTMFTGKLTDNGTRNSFLDTFHRSFNGLNGDWYGSQQDATLTNHYRLGTGTGNERGLLNRYQTDSGYRWTTGLSDAAAGEQFYQVLDELNNVYRLSIGQYNNGQGSSNNQTVINAAGTGAVVLNGSNNAGSGGVVIGSGGPASSTVATINNAGNAQFSGTLQVSGTSQSAGTMTVRNNADSEVDYYLWPGLATSQKGSFTYKDWNGNSQWYMVKDASNNWALNSALGGLDSFKAYQSNNSGDTYINASNGSGAVRVNYETGAGTAFHIYGGGSGNLYASFTGANSIKFPGLAAGSGHSCLQIDNSGYLSNTGAACSTGGTVSSGSTGQIAYYNSSGASIAGMSTVPLTAGGTGAANAAAALANLGGLPLAGGTLTGPISGLAVNGVYNIGTCGQSPGIAWCGGGTDAGAWTNNAVAQLPTTAVAGVAQNQSRITFDPKYSPYNFATTAVIPYGVEVDCQGSIINWIGGWGVNVSGSIHPAGPMIVAGVFSASSGNQFPFVHNCHFMNHGNAGYTDTDGSGNPNYTFGLLLGSDPNGLLTASNLAGFKQSIHDNVFNGFNTAITLGDNSFDDDLYNNQFSGNLNGFGAGTLFPCGGGSVGSGELVRIHGGLFDNNVGNALMMNCGYQIALDHTSLDYSGAWGWQTSISTAYRGAPSPSTVLRQAEIAGYYFNIHATDLYMEHFSGPFFQPTYSSTFNMKGGQISLTASAIALTDTLCQVTGANTAVFTIPGNNGPVFANGSPFQVSGSACTSVNGVQFTGAVVTSGAPFTITGTTTATLTVVGSIADTATLTQNVTSPTNCGIGNPSTGVYIATVTVTNQYLNGEDIVPSNLTHCPALNGQILRVGLNLNGASSSPTQVVADVSQVAGVAAVTAGAETGKVSVYNEPGLLKPVIGGSSQPSDVALYSVTEVPYHPVANLFDLSSDPSAHAVQYDQPNGGLFTPARTWSLDETNAPWRIRTASGISFQPIYTGGAGTPMIATCPNLAGNNYCEIGVGSGTAGANLTGLAWNYNSGTNPFAMWVSGGTAGLTQLSTGKVLTLNNNTLDDIATGGLSINNVNGSSGTGDIIGLAQNRGSGGSYWQAYSSGSGTYASFIAKTALQDWRSGQNGTSSWTVSNSTSGTTPLVVGTGAPTNALQVLAGGISVGGGVTATTFHIASMGAAIASSTTIAPTNQVFHVTGTTAIRTITAPAACTAAGYSCQLTLIPDGVWTTNTTGNIALATTAVVSKALTMTYDPGTGKWYPSY